MVKLLHPVSDIQRGGLSNQGLFQKPNVIILAKKFKPTPAQHRLLGRGLSFVPTVGIYRDQKRTLQLDIQNYHRRIKLASFFKDSAKKPVVPFTGPSEWTPPISEIPIEVQKFIKLDLKTFKTHYKFIEEELNISWEEETALRELKNNRQIIIKPADKGAAVAVLDRDQYVLEVERQLNDTIYYKKLKGPIYWDTISLVSDILDRLVHKKS